MAKSQLKEQAIKLRRERLSYREILRLRWLKEICGKDLEDITFDIYIHELQRYRTLEILDFWTEAIGCDPIRFQHIYYKKGNPKTLRKNIGKTYHGILKIYIKESSSLVRQIAGWTQGVVESIR
jgi:hypothetical protein